MCTHSAHIHTPTPFPTHITHTHTNTHHTQHLYPHALITVHTTFKPTKSSSAFAVYVASFPGSPPTSLGMRLLSVMWYDYLLVSNFLLLW